MPPTIGDLLQHPLHAGALQGASGVGEAHGGDRLLVRIGVWLEQGRVVRARFRATTCAALIAYAEAACALAERDGATAALDAPRLRAAVAGVHPVHHDRAVLVARALADALARRDHPHGAPA